VRIMASLLLLLVSGCAQFDAKEGAHREAVMHGVDPQQGRYQLVAATGNYPPMMIDTATGCVAPLSITDKGSIQFGETTLGGKQGVTLDECNQRLFLRTDVVGKLK
jgi:hypothetical protein